MPGYNPYANLNPNRFGGAMGPVGQSWQQQQYGQIAGSYAPGGANYGATMPSWIRPPATTIGGRGYAGRPTIIGSIPEGGAYTPISQSEGDMRLRQPPQGAQQFGQARPGMRPGWEADPSGTGMRRIQGDQNYQPPPIPMADPDAWNRQYGFQEPTLPGMPQPQAQQPFVNPWQGPARQPQQRFQRTPYRANFGGQRTPIQVAQRRFQQRPAYPQQGLYGY